MHDHWRIQKILLYQFLKKLAENTDETCPFLGQITKHKRAYKLIFADGIKSRGWIKQTAILSSRETERKGTLVDCLNSVNAHEWPPIGKLIKTHAL